MRDVLNIWICQTSKKSSQMSFKARICFNLGEMPWENMGNIQIFFKNKSNMTKNILFDNIKNKQLS